MKVYYSDKTVAVQGQQSFGGIQSPSARKPKEVADAVRNMPGIELVEPNPVSIDDLKLCHNPQYVDDVMELRVENGFGTIDQAICKTLPYTNGAMVSAAVSAEANQPTVALVSGFHHAGYNGWKGLGWFCTFNGLMVAVAKLHRAKFAIIDCDMHWGNGTDDILNHKPDLKKSVLHITFGRTFFRPHQSNQYLELLKPNGAVESALRDHQPDVILYQAGADVHVDDPYGGLLTTEQMIERDRRVFTIAKQLKIPVAWNLAGGYQVEQDGSIQKVIDLHLNTFKVCREVYQ